MAHNYVVTAHRASAVNQCETGNFTSENNIDLILGKTSRLEIFRITHDGLKLMKESGIYGRIAAIKLFRPFGWNKDLLFLLTHKYHVAILECVTEKDGSIEIITRSHGNIADVSSRPAQTGNIVIIDPLCKVIGLRLYDGTFKVIPINLNEKTLKSFNVRMEELVVPDITFLYGFTQPTIAFIYKEQTPEHRHLKTYELSLNEKEFISGPWNQGNIDSEASMLIPVPLPFGGTIVIALESILYLHGDKYKAIAPAVIKQAPITCYAPIDNNGSRYLLGDLHGRLFCLVLEKEESFNGQVDVKDIKLELIGEISIPECLTYLDNGVLYIGSRVGDSQLIRLHSEPDANGSLIEVLETYTNLGPISDMCIVDLERQGQGQLVTCSGNMKDGSLRIIRNGIGINEHGSIPLEVIKGLWSLKVGKNQVKDNHLVVTFPCETYVWMLSGEDVEAIDISGFDLKTQTLFCGNVVYDQIVQVTGNSIRLVDSQKELLTSWSPEHGQWISQASANKTQLVCSCKNILIYFKIELGKLTKISQIDLGGVSVGHIDVTPLYPEHDETNLCCVALWGDISVRILRLPNLEELTREPINIEVSSIIVATFGDLHYLLCALMNGSVFYFNLNVETGALTEKKKVTLGTRPTILKTFKSLSTNNVFACSDRPTVIYSSNHKLVFSNVNLKDVKHICPLDSEAYPDSLAMSTGKSLLFGTIDEIQKLHIRTVPLYESPVRITHQEATQTFGVLTQRIDIVDSNGVHPARPSASTQAHHTSTAASMSCATRPPGLQMTEHLGMEIETSSLLIIDQHTFEVLHSHQFQKSEEALSIISTRLGDGSRTYYVVGTGFVCPDEPEPKAGRLIVFSWQDNKLQQVAEINIKGAPYSLCEFGNKFLAGVSATVQLVELNARKDLQIECTYVNVTMALHLRRRGDFILLGDLMRSMSLFAYKPLESSFEEIARDYNPEWMTEVEILEDDIYLGAESLFNLFVCQKDSSASNDQDRQQLQQIGFFHLGDSVNVFRHGSLVMQHPGENSVPIQGSVLYGTVDGAIGLVAQIPQGFYNLLSSLQTKLNKTIKSIGKIEHSDWRAFLTSKSSQPAQNFIDGDLVESFLDLPRDQMERVSSGIEIDDGSGMNREATVEDLVKIVEDLTRIH